METIEIIELILHYVVIIVVSGLFMVNAIKIAKLYFNNDINYTSLVVLCLINGCCVAALIQVTAELLNRFYL